MCFIFSSYLIFALSCDTSKPDKNAASLKFTEELTIIKFNKEIIDFGIVQQGDTLNAKYNFKNLGDSDLLIDYVNPECGCTSYTLSQNRVLPSDSGSINLIIDTKDKLGIVNVYAIVKSNTEDKFSRLLVKANVKAN
jgi:hypothetical protein